jgi:hypothetical protein
MAALLTNFLRQCGFGYQDYLPLRQSAVDCHELQGVMSQKVRLDAASGTFGAVKVACSNIMFN